jgi:serine/threonine protein kinase
VDGIENEIRFMDRISHPNILPFREVLHVKPSKTVYLVSSFAEHGSLESVIRARSLTPQLSRYIFRNAGAGLAYLHSLRIVHQDVKPGNILLSKSGGVSLADFGMSHGFDEAITAFATPLYHAPEVLDVRPGGHLQCAGKEDVWSLGVTLYEMLFAKTPCGGGNVYEIIADIRERPLEKPDGADEEAWELITRMLALDPEERFSMEEVMASRYVTEGPDTVDFSHLAVMDVADEDSEGPVVEIKATEYRSAGWIGRPPDDGIQRRYNSFP